MKLIPPFLCVAVLALPSPSVGQEQTFLAAFDTPPIQVAVANDGRKLFTADPLTASVREWDVATGTLTRVFAVPGAAGPIALLPNGRFAVVVRERLGPIRGTPPNREPTDSVRIFTNEGKPIGDVLSFPDVTLRRSIVSLSLTPDSKKLLAVTQSQKRSPQRTDGVFPPVRDGVPTNFGEIAAWSLAHPRKPAEWLARYKSVGIRRIIPQGSQSGFVLFSDGSIPPGTFSYQPPMVIPTDGTLLPPASPFAFGGPNPTRFGGPIPPNFGFLDNADAALSNDGKWLATVSGDRLMVRPASGTAGGDGEKEIPLRGPINGSVRITFLAGGVNRLAVATPTELSLIDPETRTVLSFPPRENRQRPVSLIPVPDRRLIVVGDEGSMEIFDTAKMLRTATIPGVRPEPFKLAAFGDRLLMADRNGEVTLWSSKQHQILLATRVSDIRDTAPTFSADGKRVYLYLTSGDLVSLDADTGKDSGHVRDEDRYAVMLSPDGGLTLRANRRPNELQITEAQTGVVRSIIPMPARNGAFLFAFSPDGKALASLAHAEQRGLITLYDTATGAIVRAIPLEAAGETLHFSADGRMMIVTVPFGKRSGVITVPFAEGTTPRLVEMPAVKPGSTARKVPPWIQHIAVSPDATVAALGREDGSVTICDTATGEILRQMPPPPFAGIFSPIGIGGRAEPVTTLTFCGNATLAVSGARMVRFFDVSTGALDGTLRFLATKDRDNVSVNYGRKRYSPTDILAVNREWYWTTPGGKWDASPSARPYVRRRGATGQLAPATR